MGPTARAKPGPSGKFRAWPSGRRTGDGARLWQVARPLTCSHPRKRACLRAAATVATMPTALVSGSGGLIGSESVRYLVEQGFDVIGVENDMRAHFFGSEASTSHVTRRLTE